MREGGDFEEELAVSGKRERVLVLRTEAADRSSPPRHSEHPDRFGGHIPQPECDWDLTPDPHMPEVPIGTVNRNKLTGVRRASDLRPVHGSACAGEHDYTARGRQ